MNVATVRPSPAPVSFLPTERVPLARLAAALSLLCVLSGGCRLADAVGRGSIGPADDVFAIMPAVSDDSDEPQTVPVAVTALRREVVDWHAATDWDGLRDDIRRFADDETAAVVTVRRGEVMRFVDGADPSDGPQPRRRECWYLVVLVGSPVRPLDGSMRSCPEGEPVCDDGPGAEPGKAPGNGPDDGTAAASGPAPGPTAVCSLDHVDADAFLGAVDAAVREYRRRGDPLRRGQWQLASAGPVPVR
jgi:hypothetical protein